MKKVTLKIPDYVFAFYAEVGNKAGGLPAEKVMADALFKLAGELSLNAIDKQQRMAELPAIRCCCGGCRSRAGNHSTVTGIFASP